MSTVTEKDPNWFQDQVLDRLRPHPRWRHSRIHWYGPKSHKSGAYLHDEPLRRARYRFYTLDEYYTPNSRYYRDKHGTYVWMGTDCGWEWMATRPVLNRIPLWYRLFDDLHDRVHHQGRYK